MVLECAVDGHLRNYLENQTLTWHVKINLAYQLASAVLCLHDEGIIHCDLHSNNILVSQREIKIADFGLSKRIEESNELLNIIGVIPYLDPMIFNNSNGSLDEKSDVYSVGVLLWEIYSGQPPFYGKSYDNELALQILDGLREAHIPSTPLEYRQVYSRCWDGDPYKRPHIGEVVRILKTLVQENEDDNISYESFEEVNPRELSTRMNLRDEDFSDPGLSDLHISDNDDLKISDKISMIIKLFIDIMNEGKTRDQRRSVLESYLLSHNVTFEEVHEWLNNNSTTDMVDPNYLFFLGYLNYSGMGTTLNPNAAFKYFEKASSPSYNHLFAQYYLGICYEYVKRISRPPFIGIGRQRITDMQLHNIIFSFGLNMLGYCYSKGIGTSIDKRRAFDLYFKAASVDNHTAQYNVAVCFDEGIGTFKDFKKAIEWYKESANNGYDKARIKLVELSLLESKEEEIETQQQIIQHWNLNYGLCLNGSSIQPSKKPVLVDDGNLDLSVYKGEPIVYTNINNPNNPDKLNLLSYDNKIEFNDRLKQLDLCINFPVAEITYKADLLETISVDEEHGHIIAKKFMAGGQIFVKIFQSMSNKLMF
ncbi:kinase-like domain-containing protein [Rhizophagus diaphanus]|nr:kinase-like domain-containing protein [Rhizophagus diaphanus] [Rhizophagus sp. MUCL 43196]